MSDYYKYPRTYHLPWTIGSSSDDKILKSVEHLQGMEIVITEKMDGENTNMYNDRIHARSIDSSDHPSRSYVKQVWGRIKHEIPDGWRICGENLYAMHSIFYENLPAYFMVFSIWNEDNMCLSWSETEDICKILQLKTVPVMEIRLFDEEYLRKLPSKLNRDKQEGFVIRNVNEFHFDDYSMNTAKWVRDRHVQTDEHWMYKEVVPNKLREYRTIKDPLTGFIYDPELETE